MESIRILVTDDESVICDGCRLTLQFVAMDFSTFSSSLQESELFGHVKGAFTGGVKDKAGIFDVAEHGSLFLDESANLKLDIQAKLLRAMETREFKPVGASRLKKSNVRIITATNRDLKMMVDAGDFREDFFYDYIASYEEKLLEDRFHEDYRNYKKRTGKWVPMTGNES